VAVTKDMTVHSLLEAYPYLKDWLTAYTPEFKKLSNPVVYNTVGRAASLEAAAQLGDVSVDQLLDDIRTQVAQHEIAAEEAGGTDGEPEDRARRQEALKGIIRQLHDGASAEEVKREFDALSTEVDSAEIAAMEQALIAEGMPVEDVQRLCDVHVSVFKDALEVEETLEVEEGHPVSAYLSENVIVEEITAALRGRLDELAGASDEEARGVAMQGIVSELDRLAQIDVHYVRKENQLFPPLERHEIEGPTKVMWGLHDDIRGRLKQDRALVQASDADGLGSSLPETLQMIDDMVYKEEKILFPAALQVIPDEEWAEIAAGDQEIGYAWIEAPPPFSVTFVAKPPASGVKDGESTLIPLPTGALSIPQLDILFRNLPFDVTYVDEEDRVRFYSEGMRVFPRSPAAIGREVRNCHPSQSVDRVEAILSAFKAGEEDVAEFWLELEGKFVHIRYFALRDDDGTYQGCLEVVQDATYVRSLEGQRRLLDW